MKFALALLLVSFTAAAADHSHGSHGKLQLNQGKKWATTEDLRQGMEKIRVLVSGAIPEIHDHKMKPAGFKALADHTSQEVAQIIKTCRLEPRADAMLHLVLERLQKGAGEMERGKSFDAQHEGAMELVSALQQYNRYFDHPGWKGVSH